MATEYRKHLVAQYGDEVVAEFDDNYRKVSPVKSWPRVIADFAI